MLEFCLDCEEEFEETRYNDYHHLLCREHYRQWKVAGINNCFSCGRYIRNNTVHNPLCEICLSELERNGWRSFFEDEISNQLYIYTHRPSTNTNRRSNVYNIQTWCMINSFLIIGGIISCGMLIISKNQDQ